LWLPDTKIRLNFSQYGFEQLLGAIKTRAQKQGSALRSETAVTRAARLHQDSTARAQRTMLLEQKGHEGALKEHAAIRQYLQNKILELRQTVPGLSIEYGCDANSCVLRTTQVSINFNLHIGQPAPKSSIVLREWCVQIGIPPKVGMYFRQPEPVGEYQFYIDYQTGVGWCWHEGSSAIFLTSEAMGEHILKLLMDLHERLERGEIQQPQGQDYWDQQETDEGNIWDRESES
jgi:hypothetical protein